MQLNIFFIANLKYYIFIKYFTAIYRYQIFIIFSLMCIWHNSRQTSSIHRNITSYHIYLWCCSIRVDFRASSLASVETWKQTRSKCTVYVLEYNKHQTLSWTRGWEDVTMFLSSFAIFYFPQCTADRERYSDKVCKYTLTCLPNDGDNIQLSGRGRPSKTRTLLTIQNGGDLTVSRNEISGKS